MERAVNARAETPVNSAVVLNELNAEVADGSWSLTLSDLVEFGVDVAASRLADAGTVVFIDGSKIMLGARWWAPVSR
jgi:hypothetical protein